MTDETKTIVFGQPNEISIKVGLSIGAKGERKPEVVITSISKCDDIDINEVNTIIHNSIIKCKDTIKLLMEE